MYKKYSDTPISEFIDLGNNTYEFCFNIEQYEENVDDDLIVRYKSDVILINNIDNIVETLLRDRYSSTEELKILNIGLINKEDNTYLEYKKYTDLINFKYNKFYLSDFETKTVSYLNKNSECEINNKEIIFRFNEVISGNTYTYDEYIFHKFSKINDVYNGIIIINDFIENNILSDGQCIKFMSFFDKNKTLNEIKKEKILEFNPILDSFSILITKCKLLYPNDSNLDKIIQDLKTMKDNTILLINSYQSISEILKFKYKIEDINEMKELFNKYIV